MVQLTGNAIQLAARAANKEEAIRLAGRLLSDAGYIDPGYTQSMLGREQQANTYLGNGIAIPHGMQQDRELIHRTGISVVQFPDGVEWNPGEKVHLVVGIAAKSDEHLQILANLTDVLDDPQTVQRLAHTNDPNDIARQLSRSRDGDDAPAAPAAPAALADDFAGARSIDVQVLGSAGLHARPATFFVNVAKQFDSDIRVEHNGKTGNGKAMASLLKLGVEGGNTIRILARGSDQDAALSALQEAVENGLGEADEVEEAVETYDWTPQSELHTIAGVAASPGLAIGRVHQIKHTKLVVEDKPKDQETERRQLNQALETARQQLQDLYAEVKERSGANEAAIFQAHQAFLEDPDLIDEARRRIGAGHSAAWSWHSVIEERVADVRQLGDERLAARATDLHDIGQRVLRFLVPTTEGEPTLPDEPVIVLAEDLTPSDTAQLDPRRTLGFCTALGGPTSHTAIIARSLDIPAIVGAGAALLEQPDGMPAILDGGAGKLYLEPREADVESAQQMQNVLRGKRDEEHAARYRPALLTDGHRVEVVANIGKAADAAQAIESGAEGVGLMRTEFLFLGRDTAPSEEEQYEAYREMVEAMNGLPLIIRTLDIGGDKEVPYLSLPAEDNPFLGVRGVRLCFRNPDLFKTQLRAIYRASMHGPLMIMFPMIATLEDLREAKEIAEQVQQEIGALPVEIGMMVEVPSAVAMAPEFAEEIDFFSIGTNDLTQYVLAIDRLHPVLAKQVDGLHPAVLRMIDQVVQAANAAGTWVGVCGGVAGEPEGAVILTGLGVRELSMSIPSIAAVKARLRRLSHAQARQIARRALKCSTAAEVRQLVLP